MSEEQDGAEDYRLLVPKAKDRSTLAELGVTGIDDLLRRFPRRWVDPGRFTEIVGLGRLEEGTDAIIHATVVEVDSRRMRSRRGSLTTVRLSDGTDEVEAVFFNQPWMAAQLPPGKRILVSAKIKHYRGRLQLGSPTLLTADGRIAQRSDSVDELLDLEPSRPIPVYPGSAKLNSNRFRALVTAALDTASDVWFSDPVPERLRERHRLIGLREAYEAMHRPRTMEEVHRAQKRWPYEEALALQVHLLQRRQEHEALHALALAGDERRCLEAFDERLPFELTLSQQHEGIIIADELAGARPMNRLLQGEVGSGKTLVAIRAMLQAVDSGAQAVMLAPTEVLAAQHYRSLVTMLGDQAVPVRGQRTLFAPDAADAEGLEDGPEVAVALLTGSLPKGARQEMLTALFLGHIDIVVGTHALLSDSTMFHRLGLVVVDEQHRFGVEQRAALRQKAGDRTPHTLVMTATPIPRSAALTVFGDLDFSSLTDLPTGPKQITTHVVPLRLHPTWIDRVYQVVAEHIAQGQQAFVVLPRIEASPDEDGTVRPGVFEYAALLQNHPALSDATIDILHGQMSAPDKDAAMRAFAAGETDVLVSTTVIEVGIDVAGARVMVLIDADRFGVAQLHQLRGRVGRAGDASVCFLVTEADPESDAMARLRTVASTLDGYELARFDILSRREGDVLGRRQWGGRSSLRHLSVFRDESLIRGARGDAEWLLGADPALLGTPALARLIAALFRDTDEEIFEAG